MKMLQYLVIVPGICNNTAFHKSMFPTRRSKEHQKEDLDSNEKDIDQDKVIISLPLDTQADLISIEEVMTDDDQLIGETETSPESILDSFLQGNEAPTQDIDEGRGHDSNDQSIRNPPPLYKDRALNCVQP